MPTFPDEATHADAPSPSRSDDAYVVQIPLQRYSPVNLLLIVGSVALTLWTNFGQNLERLLPWLISNVPANAPDRLIEVRHGEIWRLLTPAFLHFSVAHIGFNMVNMVSLGNLLERRIRSPRYLLLTVGIAVCSDLGQYFVTNSPLFGGMSGVVYGIFGYIWLRGRNDRTFGLTIPPQFIVLALGWLVLCFTPVIPQVANAAHPVGLIFGALWGFTDGRPAMRREFVDPVL